MGKIKANGLINGMSGKIGRLVLKKYSYGIVITSAPDRSEVKLSRNQKKANGNFKLAVAYAKSVIKDPEKRKVYEARLEPGKSVYHTALAEYLNKNK